MTNVRVVNIQELDRKYAGIMEELYYRAFSDAEGSHNEADKLLIELLEELELEKTADFFTRMEKWYN